jgi:hypothetical protein
MLVKGFAGVLGVKDERSVGIDIAGEERAGRVRECRDGFGDLRVQLEELKKSPGYVGVAVRDCLKELSLF